MYPFQESQLGFPGTPCANGLGSQTPGSGTESLSPEAAAAVAAVVGLRQQMQMAAAAQHESSGYNLPAHCANIHGNNGGSAGSIPMPKLGSPAASGQLGNSGGTSVPMPRLASPAMPGMSNNPHSLSGLSGLHLMQGMMAGVQPSQLTVSSASNGGSHSASASSANSSVHSSSHAMGHHITSTTTVNSGNSLNISRLSSPASSAHDLRMNSPDDQLHSPMDMPMETAGVNLAVGVSGMSYKSSRGYSPPRPEHMFHDDINEFVSAAAQRSCPSRLSGFKEPSGGIKIEPMTECRGE